MRLKIALSILLSVLLLSACGPKTPAVPTPLPTDTPTPAPTLTPTPSTPLAILILPADMDPESSDLYQKTVYDLAQASGFRFQLRNALSPAEASDPMLKLVIALPPDPGVVALAAAAPQARFLAINIPGLNAGGNLSVLSNQSDSNNAAFLAGYTAAMLTEDYKIGMLIPKDNAEAMQALHAFTNGMAYYCGLCRPFFLASYTYPQYIEIPADEKKEAYSAYADYLILQRNVKTIYVYPDVATSDLLTYIGTTGVMSIANGSPMPRPAGFIMAMQPDVIQAIQSAWPNLISGQGGVNVQSPLGLTDIDPALLTPGKQRLVEETLKGLLDGTIVAVQ